jgi:hypothetical protein
MNFILQPWQLFFLILASWVNRRQQEMIEFYRAELEAMMKAQGKKRILLTDDQRRLLAVKGKSLGRKALMEMTTIVTPDTILRWHRQLVSQKWDSSNKRNYIGRPRITTVEVWTKGGLVTFYLLFVMELKTRRVHLAACTASLGDDFMKQIAKNLTDPFDGFLKDKKVVLMDRDANFSCAFRTILEDSGVEPVRLPTRSPDLNSHIERFHLSIKSECISRMIFFGEDMLRNAVRQYLEHYHGERNHQSLNNELIDAGQEVGCVAGKIQCRERLGGLLRYYYRDAA